jgi:hypothetical protein
MRVRGYVRKYSDAPITFLLKARRPEKYRDRARSSSRPAWYGYRTVCSATDSVIAGENGALSTPMACEGLIARDRSAPPPTAITSGAFDLRVG